MCCPKISIITITYNSEKTLQRTIDSVKSQQYKNYEYIIIDGGSTDATVDIIKNNRDAISKWISESDEGISDAFNKGIRMAEGDIIGLINSDDMLAPNAMQYLSEAYSENVDVYCGNQELWNESTNVRSIVKPTTHYSFNGMNNICHPATFISKKAYKKYGTYDVSCKYCMDYDLLIRFERAGAKIIHVNHTLACFTMGGVTFTKFTDDRMNEIIRVYRKNGAKEIDIFRYKVIRKVKNTLINLLGRDCATYLNKILHKK